MTTTTDPAAARAALAVMRGRAREFIIHGMCECLGHPYANDIHFAWQPCPPEQRLAQAIEADLPALLSVAEAVASVGPLVVARDADGQMTSVTIRGDEWDAVTRALAALAAGGETGEVGDG